MYKTSNSNFVIASYLIFIMTGLGVIKYFYYPKSMLDLETISIAIFNLVFFSGLGVLVRQGYNWIKYLILVFAIVGLLNIYQVMIIFPDRPTVIGFTMIAQRFILVAATIMIFNKNKNLENQHEN
jgi:hypothetical protein